MIAKINLLIKYRSFEFIPQVYNLDFSVEQDLPLLGGKFDYIATNPTWGAKNHTSDQDSFSRIFIKSFSLLKKNGTIKFLFPESILNVKSHQSERVLSESFKRLKQPARPLTLGRRTADVQKSAAPVNTR